MSSRKGLAKTAGKNPYKVELVSLVTLVRFVNKLMANRGRPWNINIWPLELIGELVRYPVKNAVRRVNIRSQKVRIKFWKWSRFSRMPVVQNRGALKKAKSRVLNEPMQHVIFIVIKALQVWVAINNAYSLFFISNIVDNYSLLWYYKIICKIKNQKFWS